MSDQNPTGTDNIQQLRDAAERGRQAERENAELKRKMAMVEAGVDLKHPAAPYFVEGYKGELTEDAIKAEAAKIGVLAAPAPSTSTTEQEAEETEPVPTPALTPEQQAQDLLATQVAAEAAGASLPPEKDLVDVGFERFHQGMQQGRTRDDAAAEVIHRVVAKGVGLGEQRAG